VKRNAPDMPITISFKARVGDKAFACGNSYDSWTPTDLRLFVSDLRLISESGNEQPLVLDEDGQWQGQGVAMLDFEDGSGACLNGTAETRTIVTGRVAAGKYTGIAFSIGVPFELNHADPSSAPAPMNVMSMQWNWRAGHKFMRFGAQTHSGNHYEIHLGSTNCEGTIGHVSRCDRPNRPHFVLNGFDPNRNVIVLDIEKLLEGLVMAAHDADGGKSGCMSGAEDVGCVPVFKNLGLDLRTGDSLGLTKVFGVE